MLCREPLADRGNGGRGLLVGYALAEPPEDTECPECAPVLRDVSFSGGAEWTRQHGHVDVVLLRIMRHAGQHTDDAMGPVVHLEYASDNRRVGAKFLPPIPVAE